jgi:hypothetical protein
VPDHSWLSRTRSRLPIEVHDRVFTWVLERLAEHGLIKGERIGLDRSLHCENRGSLALTGHSAVCSWLSTGHAAGLC